MSPPPSRNSEASSTTGSVPAAGSLNSPIRAGSIVRVERGHGRTPTYTPEQDEIILTTEASDEVNAKFVERGYDPRSAQAIASRRAYLRRTGTAISDGNNPAVLLEQTFRQWQRLQRERDKLSTHLARVEAELTEVTARLAQLTGEVAARDEADT